MSRMKRTTVPSESPIRQPVVPKIEPLVARAPAPVQPKPEAAPEVPDSGTSEVPESGSAEVSDSGSLEGSRPKWRGLERKETRLRADQLAELAALRRRVSGQRRNRSEIITDNTLIRVAVDLLLTRAGRLKGDTEAELLGSVSPRRRTQE